MLDYHTHKRSTFTSTTKLPPQHTFGPPPNRLTRICHCHTFCLSHLPCI